MMDIQNNHKKNLRERAEEVYRRSEHNLDLLSDEAVKELIQELQVHQIELAMQNEELRKAQHEIEKVHERYVHVYDDAPVGYITSDPTGNVVMVNQTLIDMLHTNKKELLCRGMAPFCDNQDAFYLHCRKALKKKRAVSSEILITPADGQAFWATIESKSVSPPQGTKQENLVRSIIIDISEKKHLEEELRRVQKLESIGVLAGGIAHDFNNILEVILVNIELAKLYSKSCSKAYPKLTDAAQAVLRAKELTIQLLTFAKGGEPIKAAVSLPNLIKDTARFALHGSNVACNYHIPDDLWKGDVDPGQMGQVIQNIVINARQAMPEGGTIEISCKNVPNGKEEGALLAANTYIKIVISDTGCGIYTKYLDKIFDPYFSTKQTGSGLGLSICQSIIAKHDGTISVYSKPEEGTAFTIFVPAATEKVTSSPRQKAIPSSETANPATILVMDDEEPILKLMKEQLENQGHKVLLARNGEKAVSLFAEQGNNGQNIDLVIMDLTIPGGMGGKEAVKEVLRIDPDAKVIVASGYSNDPVMAHYKDYGFKAALSKPFQTAKLRKMINLLLQ